MLDQLDIDYTPTRSEAVEQTESYHLTAREQEILRYRCRGLSYKEVGVRCFISPETVKSHMNSVFKKLNPNRRPTTIDHGGSNWLCYLLGMMDATEVLPPEYFDPQHHVTVIEFVPVDNYTPAPETP